jgi:uncharacterized membrane protein
MGTLPLHPAIVHLPLGLALLMPLIAAVATWALWTGRITPRSWILVAALQVLLVGAGVVALRTGSAEEDRVERVVQEAAIERHEEAAEQFVWASGAVLVVLAVVPWIRRPGIARAVAVAGTLTTVVVTGLALRAGHAGGQLVYVHGAAAAYTDRGQQARTGGASAAPAGVDRDDDDDQRRR